MTLPQLPKNWVLGAATAAYQIEGAAREDGKGLSVWDIFSAQPGKTFQGHTGDTACDHYRRYREDVALLNELGADAYRFSVSWPRVLPEGTGSINAVGLDFYDRLVDSLLAAGITPWATLFHWDYPVALHHRGGWLNRDSAEWFAGYAEAVADRLGDRVRHWFTLNEPQIFIGCGYQYGVMAPGFKLPFSEVLTAVHHTLLAHGMAVGVLRAKSPGDTRIGWASTGTWGEPASGSPADVEAARKWCFKAWDECSGSTSLWNDPVYLGRYPEESLAQFEKYGVRIGPGDMQTISAPLDFAGVNYYQSAWIREGADGKPEQVHRPAGAPRTAFGWDITPTGFYWFLKFFADRYKKPLVISENGLSCHDWPDALGAVEDPQRISYMDQHLRQLARAHEEGARTDAYFYWSFLDNFEWCDGYKQRFGLVHVDYQTQARTPKSSFRWFQNLIKTRAAT